MHYLLPIHPAHRRWARRPFAAKALIQRFVSTDGIADHPALIFANFDKNNRICEHNFESSPAGFVAAN
jgi:hypothetical protein